jgi:hypothetical protein
VLAERCSVVFVAALAGYLSCTAIAAAAGNGQTPTIRTTTSLVLVDALVQDRRTGAPIEELQRDDFVLRQDGRVVEISSFNRGKELKLRPVQLWFVVMCNEVRQYPADSRRQTQSERTEQWGASFLAGKTQELRPALEHLYGDDTVGVAHWCDDRKSDIDVRPSAEREKALEAMERLARAQAVIIDPFRFAVARDEIASAINRTAQTAFPVPFVALIYMGGRESARGAGKQNDIWSGSIEEASMDPGLPGRSETTETTTFAIQSKDYPDRLAAFLDLVHRRYEIGFAPGKDQKNLHHIRLELTRKAKNRYPDAVLRYREVYNDQPHPSGADTSKADLDWTQLDNSMRQAVNSAPSQSGLTFNVRRAQADGKMEQFAVQIAADVLTWRTLPNGDRRSVLTAVVASYSAKGQAIGLVVKEFEIVQEFARLPELQGKPVSFSVNARAIKGATKLRLLVRDVASGQIGSLDL